MHDGWRRFGQAQPNDAHHALARLEAKRSRPTTAHPERGPAAAGGREAGRSSTFTGASIPRDQVVLAMESLQQADGMLVVGPSFVCYPRCYPRSIFGGFFRGFEEVFLMYFQYGERGGTRTLDPMIKSYETRY